MIVPLLAGAAKTLDVSMLSERVVLRILVMLSEWAAAKSTNSLDDCLVSEMKAKLESDGKIWSGPLILRRQLNAVSGIAMLDMITPNSAKPKCRADAVAVLITWTSSSWRCCSSFGINLDRSRLLQESVARSIIINQAGIRSPLIFNPKEQIFGSLDLEPFSWSKKQGGLDFPE